MSNLANEINHSSLLNKIKETIKERSTKVWPYKLICKTSFDHILRHHITNCLHEAIVVSVKVSSMDHLLYDLESNCALHYTKSLGLGFTRLSKLLEQMFLVLVNLLIIYVWKVTITMFSLILWCNVFLWRSCNQVMAEIFDNSSDNVKCIKAVTHVQQLSSTEICDLFRSINKKHAEKEMNKNLHVSNFEASGLLGSDTQVLAKSTTPNVTKHLPPAVKAVPPKVDSSLIQQSCSYTEPNASCSDVTPTTGYTTSKLPGATASLDQHYETNFDEDMPLLSTEETRKNVRPVPKEKDVDSLLQSYQKGQINSTATTGNIPPLLIQNKTKPSAKTVPSLSVNKSHRSLPRRTCLVHLKEQYHLDHNLLSQPRATKYLVKVRTEISPGRYMAKLELCCSR